MGVTTHLPPADTTADTTERLLDSAERLFATHGFAATSVRDITQAAGCNLASVNYHFGGKLNLYREVFRRRLRAMREQRVASLRLASPGLAVPTLQAVLTAFATAFLEPLVAKSGGRHMIELLAREMLDPQLDRRLFHDEIIEPVHTALVAALTAAAPGLAPERARLCAVSLVGQLMHVVHRARCDGVGLPPAGLPPLGELVDHIVRFSAAGVRACAGSPVPAGTPEPNPRGLA